MSCHRLMHKNLVYKSLGLSLHLKVYNQLESHDTLFQRKVSIIQSHTSHMRRNQYWPNKYQANKPVELQLDHYTDDRLDRFDKYFNLDQSHQSRKLNKFQKGRRTVMSNQSLSSILEKKIYRNPIQRENTYKLGRRFWFQPRTYSQLRIDHMLFSCS